jgi:hypothetical protein
MTMSSVLSSAPSVAAPRLSRDGVLSRLWAAFELAGRRRAARQLLTFDDAVLQRAGLDRAELEETLR